MFDFLRPCKKNVPLERKKTNFDITHCITTQKCETGKTVSCKVNINYDQEVEKYFWPDGNRKFTGEIEVFKSSAELGLYIDRLKLLQAKLEDVKCKMKAEEA